MYDMLIMNKNLDYVVVEINENGKILKSWQLPRHIQPLVGKVSDDALIKWRKGLNPDFIFTKSNDRLRIKIGDFEITVSKFGVRFGGGWRDLCFKECGNFRKSIKIAKDYASIALYEKELQEAE